jgi:2-polyprenyl-6-methoxyphenol hydroxylase-like FAD-dependent oxidoreductase
VLATAPYGFIHIVRPLLDCPYRKDALLGPTLFHSMLIVWAVAIPALVTRILWLGGRVLSVEVACLFGFAYVTFSNAMIGSTTADVAAAAVKAQVQPIPAAMLRKTGVPSHCCEASSPRNDAGSDPYIYRQSSVLSLATSSPPRFHMSSVATVDATTDEDVRVLRNDDYCVAVVGAGVAGLVAAATLRRLGISVILLERKASSVDAESGADLALWPSAITILRELGVPDDFFLNHCYPLDTVQMCNMDFAASNATVLKTLDMKRVTGGTGERFVLISRVKLMSALRDLVPSGAVIYGATVDHVEENEESDSATVYYKSAADGEIQYSISSRIVIGADGAHSALRSHVVKQAGGDASVRYCGEVCYRGVIPLTDDGRACDEVLRSLFSAAAAGDTSRTMRINYGAGLRSSIGYMSFDKSVGYWWVKQLQPEDSSNRDKLTVCSWPEPLKTLHDLTPLHSFYVHAIEDCAVLPKWSSPRVVLAGDSAHAVSPNMGQGACQAVEDSFVLATQLGQFWGERDGQLEAFYIFERTRKPFTNAVRSEARMQLLLGQLQRPWAVAVREAVLRYMPTSVLEGKLIKQIFPVTEYISSFRAIERDTLACR